MTTEQATRKFRVKTNGASGLKEKVKLSVGHAKGNDDSLTADEAEQFLCGRRVEVVLTPDDEQMSLPGTEKAEIKALCDIKSYSSKTSGYSFSLIFEDDEVDLAHLAPFQFAWVAVELKLVGPAADENEDDE